MRMSHGNWRVLVAGLGAAVLCSGLTAGRAWASPVVYTSESAFIAALSPGYFHDNFGSLSPFNSVPLSVVSATGGTPAVTYDITAPPSGLFINNDSGFNAVGNWVQSQDVIVSLTSGNVYAIGAEFYLCDFNGVKQDGQISISFSDGASGTATSSATGPYGFLGVIDSGLITSMTVTHSSLGYLNMANLYLGGVPEPSSLLLLGLSALAFIRRR